MEDHFTFTSPQECPVFRPTKEEFRDPLEYIDQIKPIAVKSGICKIIPPDDWRPPFSVNVNSFQFTPRVQKLYELEAQSRIKLNFMTKLSQFVSLQGNDKLKIPNINGRHVDLYKLHKLVNEEGGYDHVTVNKIWPKIGNKLGYKNSSQVSSLRTHYEKIVLPYDIMFTGTTDAGIFDTHSIVKPRPVLHPSTTKKRKSIEPIVIDSNNVESSLEVKKLQFVGVGPRLFNGAKEEIKMEEELTSGPLKRKCLSDYICKVCGRGDREDRLLICDNEECQQSYHCECLVPPIVNIPKQSWKCQNCVLKVLNKKPVEYGFPSSSTTYTLYDFGRSADRFKANYFGKELHEVVPCSTVEKEFWRILQSFNDDVIVEYGADIHSSHQGSGFPTAENIENGKCTRNNGEQNMDLAIKYSKEAWNLNNLPVNKKSILSYIRGNIDGMKVPWCYVGMVFSSFCWHIEDHWSFSINYLHWGEPKTWYGVSSENAVQFEAAMRKQAPELFENNEDLLHHITTTMNPNILQREGVPIYRTDQHAGQYVVTFPRAYHTGFNQGFNFAEAVNFCPATWLPMGRACIEQYVKLGRHCVFSHEELLCTIAEAALLEFDDISDEQVPIKYPLMSQLGLPRDQISLDTNIRRVVYSELEIMIREEDKCRTTVKEIGVTKSEKRMFENMQDDERACAMCQTTVFLSALECMCVNNCHNSAGDGDDGDDDDCVKEESAEIEEGELNECDTESMKTRRIVCLRHLQNWCEHCPAKECTLLYRFDLEEMHQLLLGLQVGLQDFHSWEASIKSHFTEGPIDGHRRGSLEQLRSKLDEGAECGFDSCEDYVKGRGLLERGENLVNVCGHWLRAIQESDDCGKAIVNSLPQSSMVPKSVLVDCVYDNGAKVEIKNINVANLTEENLGHMSQTLARFPVTLPCSQFEEMVERLLQWRQDSHSVMDSYHCSTSTIANGSDPGQLLPKVVTLFEEAKRLFSGWSAFSNERTCLMLMGKSLQWLVRIRECEDLVKKGKATHLDRPGDQSMSLPVTLIKDSVLIDMVRHGETLLSSIKETALDLGDLGHRFLDSISNGIELALAALYGVMAEINRLRDESLSLAKRGLSTAVLSSLRSASEHCLCMGVRIKELDDARVRIYKSCIETILATKPGRFVCLDHASQVLQLGGALFTEAVLDRDNGPLTQRHLAAKAQLSLVSRAVRKLNMAYNGPAVTMTDDSMTITGTCAPVANDNDNDRVLLSMLLPRHYSGDDSLNRDCLLRNCALFMHTWLSPPPLTQLIQAQPSSLSSSVTGVSASDCHMSLMMTTYQTMMVQELASIDQLSSPSLSLSPTIADNHWHQSHCCIVCLQSLIPTSGDNTISSHYCHRCAPRSRRPTITDMAQLNKLLKQCPNIVSIHGVALQALSKRTVTWLESLVTVLRVNSKYLAKYYWSLAHNSGDDSDELTAIPVCIKELFIGYQSLASTTVSRPHHSTIADSVSNLRYLLRVGHCLEVNVDSYLSIISSLLLLIQKDQHQNTDNDGTDRR